jgi:hypothetical protein
MCPAANRPQKLRSLPDAPLVGTNGRGHIIGAGAM